VNSRIKDIADKRMSDRCCSTRPELLLLKVVPMTVRLSVPLVSLMLALLSAEPVMVAAPALPSR
jgi:hypothetical protein